MSLKYRVIPFLTMDTKERMFTLVTELYDENDVFLKESRQQMGLEEFMTLKDAVTEACKESGIQV